MNSVSVATRLLEVPDFKGWKALWRQYLRFYRAEFSENSARDTFSRLVNDNSDLIGLVAVDETPSLAGLVHLVFHASTWSAAPYCYIEDLFVSSSARGGNVATLLIEAAYAQADQRGASRTYWHTQQYNGAARSLYDQVGHPTSFMVYER